MRSLYLTTTSIAALLLLVSCSSDEAGLLTELPEPKLIPSAVVTVTTPSSSTSNSSYLPETSYQSSPQPIEESYPEAQAYQPLQQPAPQPEPIVEVRYGLAKLDDPGKIVVSAMLDEIIYLPTANLYIGASKSEDKRVISIYSEEGKLLTTYTDESIESISPYGLIFVSNKEGKVGAKTPAGKEVISPLYNELFQLDEDLVIGKHDNKYYFIVDGKELSNVSFDDVIGMLDDYILVENSDKFGFVDKKGKELVPTIYEDLRFFSDGLAPAKIGGKWGFIDSKGKEVIVPSYDEVMNFTEEVAFVKKDGKWGTINKKGEFIVSPRWERARPYVKGLAPVRMSGKWGAIDKEGNVVIPIDFQDIRLYPAEGVIFVRKEDKWGLYKWNGEQIVSPRYDRVRDFAGAGLAPVRLGDQWGYINTKGEMVISARFSDAYPFLPCYDIAVVEEKEKDSEGSPKRTVRFINKEGKYASPPLESIQTREVEAALGIEMKGKYGRSFEYFLRRLMFSEDLSGSGEGSNLLFNKIWWIRAMRTIDVTHSSMCVVGFDYVRPASQPEAVTTLTPQGKLGMSGSSTKK